jgi:putative membrane protein
MNITRNILHILLSLGVAVLLIGVAAAQSNYPGSSTKSNASTSSNEEVSPAAQRFMDEAALSNMAEVDLGKLAQQNAERPEVKDFGERMVTDHTKANDSLKQVAAQQKVNLPAGLDKEFEVTRARLAKLHGHAFDEAYMKDMVTNHRKDVAEFKSESATLKDPALKEWTEKTLPVLESHLQEAEKVAPTVGVKLSAKNESRMSAMAH